MISFCKLYGLYTHTDMYTLLERINKFSKSAWYKGIHLYFHVLSMTNSEMKLRGNSLHNSIEKKKILREKNFKKRWKTCILKTAKHHWKKLKKTQINGKTTLCSFIRRLDSVKRAILPKLINRFSTILIKISAAFICKNWLAEPKSHVEMQEDWGKLKKKRQTIASVGKNMGKF